MDQWALNITVGASGAIASAIASRLVVPCILGCTEASVLSRHGGTIPRPSFAATDAFWNDVWKRGAGGAMLGALEVIIFFASLFADGGWPLLAAWLAFKVACQWESWKHSDGFIQLAREGKNPDDLLAVQRWVSVRYISFLVGTGSNIVIAVIAASIARAFLQANAAGMCL